MLVGWFRIQLYGKIKLIINKQKRTKNGSNSYAHENRNCFFMRTLLLYKYMGRTNYLLIKMRFIFPIQTSEGKTNVKMDE